MFFHSFQLHGFEGLRSLKVTKWCTSIEVSIYCLCARIVYCLCACKFGFSPYTYPTFIQLYIYAYRRVGRGLHQKRLLLLVKCKLTQQKYHRCAWNASGWLAVFEEFYCKEVVLVLLGANLNNGVFCRVTDAQENLANNTTVVYKQATILMETTKLNSTTVTAKHVTSTATVAQASPAELTKADKRTQPTYHL